MKVFWGKVRKKQILLRCYLRVCFRGADVEGDRRKQERLLFLSYSQIKVFRMPWCYPSWVVCSEHPQHALGTELDSILFVSHLEKKIKDLFLLLSLSLLVFIAHIFEPLTVPGTVVIILFLTLVPICGLVPSLSLLGKWRNWSSLWFSSLQLILPKKRRYCLEVWGLALA